MTSPTDNLFYTFLAILFVLCECKDEIKPPPQRTYIVQPGESVTLEWSYSLAQFSEFVSIQCGNLPDIAAKSIKILAKKEAGNNFSPVVPQPDTYTGRIYTSEITNQRTIILTIKPVQRSDFGYYRCDLKIYDSNNFKVKEFSSRITTVSDSTESALESSNSEAKKRNIILAAIFGFVGFIIIVVAVICVFVYKRKTKAHQVQRSSSRQRHTKDDIKRKYSTDDEDEDEEDENGKLDDKTRSKNFLEKKNSGPHYAKVDKEIEIVKTPSEALNRTKYYHYDSKEDNRTDSLMV